MPDAVDDGFSISPFGNSAPANDLSNEIPDMDKMDKSVFNVKQITSPKKSADQISSGTTHNVLHLDIFKGNVLTFQPNLSVISWHYWNIIKISIFSQTAAQNSYSVTRHVSFINIRLYPDFDLQYLRDVVVHVSEILLVLFPLVSGTRGGHLSDDDASTKDSHPFSRARDEISLKPIEVRKKAPPGQACSDAEIEYRRARSLREANSVLSWRSTLSRQLQ